MNGTARPARERPVLAWTLALAGLSCGALAFATAALDLPAMIEHRLAAAEGAGSAETAAWLRSGALTTHLAVVGALLAAAALGAWRWPVRRSALEDGRERRWLVPAVVVGLVALNFRSTLTGGFFRYDDFELIAVARDGDFWTSWWQIHGDHFLPLTRVLFWAAYHAFGVHPLPYNAWLLVLMTTVLLTADRLLATEGASLAARLGFAVLFACWSPIAEIMSGYYILSTYLLIAWLGLVVAWALRLPANQPRGWRAAIAGVAVALAPLVDVSGFYVAGIAAVALATNVLRADTVARGWRQERTVIVALAGSLTLALAISLYAYLVRSPGSFLAMAGTQPRGPGRLLADLLYLLDAGVLLTMAVPFIYARLPAAVLGVLLALTALVTAAYLVRAWRCADRSRRGTFVAWCTIVAGVALMVALGRHDPETVVVRWAAKHIVPVFLWTALVLALGFDGWWRSANGPAQRRLGECAAALLVLYVLAQSAVGLLGMAVAFPPFGYDAEIRDAGRRRAAVATLRDELGPRLLSLGEKPIVPTVDGAVLEARWPSLFHYNLSHYAAFIEDGRGRLGWVRNSAMQPWFAPMVVTVPDLRRAVSPTFLAGVAADPVLRSFYFAPQGLESEAAESVAPATRLAVPRGSTVPLLFDGGSAPGPDAGRRLVLVVERVPASTAPIDVQLTFRSDVVGGDWTGAIRLSPGQRQIVDLGQVPAFALGTTFSNFRLTFEVPGHYRIRLAQMMP